MGKARGASTWGIHWPWLKYQQCHCDAGYEGDDCSLRRCPKGDDPETECLTDRGIDYQKLTCEFENAAVKKAFFQLRFTDQFGGEYDTRPIKVDVDKHTGKQQILQYMAKAACTSGSQPLFRTAAANGDLT